MNHAARLEVLNLAIDGLERRLPKLKRPSAIAYWDTCLTEARNMLAEVRAHLRAVAPTPALRRLNRTDRRRKGAACLNLDERRAIVREVFSAAGWTEIERPAIGDDGSLTDGNHAEPSEDVERKLRRQCAAWIASFEEGA